MNYDKFYKAMHEAVSPSGQVILKKAYYGMFYCYPNEFVKKIEHEDKVYDMLNITNDLLEKAVPECLIFRNDVIFKKSHNSCADDDEVDEIITGHAYVNGEAYDPNVVVVDDDTKVIYLIGLNSVRILYSDFTQFNGKNHRELIEEFTSALPVRNDDAEDGATIDLVLYDNGFYTETSSINPVNIDIDANYNDDFKDVYEKLESFIKDDERKSGLAILNGEPGTGKTMLIRHLITNVRKKYVFIPPSIATKLSDPEFVGFLISNRDSIFVMEDCENVVMERDNNIGFASAVSAVLNISDGLMSDMFNIKFICTFNMDKKKIDSAILRPGRCFVNYEFGKLDLDKTKALMEKNGCVYDEKDLKEMTVSEIYNWKSKTEVVRKKEKKIGF